MTAPLTHVTFGQSAAGSLKKALRTLGRGEEVICLADDLAYGPIDPPEPGLRDAWRVAELGDEPNPELVSVDESFWRRVPALQAGIVAWMSRRDAREYCGLLALLARAQAPISVIDVADVEFPAPATAMTFGFVSDTQIVERKLLDRAIRVSAESRDVYLADWQRLRDEDSALRVMTSTGIVSAPLTYFDDTVISCVTTEWQMCGRVIANAMLRVSPGPFLQGGGESFLFLRLLILIDSGVLEGRNEHELWSMRESWVRLLR